MKLPFSSFPRSSRWLGTMLAAVFMAMPLAPGGVAAQNLPDLGDSGSDALPPAVEQKLGQHIMRGIRRHPAYMNDGPLLDYLNSFGAHLYAAGKDAHSAAVQDLFFFGIRNGGLNAFALPGGFIGVYSGLLLAAQSESELAGVLAHEIGHVTQRHIARMLGGRSQDSLIPMAGILLAILAAGSSPDLANAAVAGSSGLALQRQLNFSRDAEREADRIGLQILRNGGFDSSGMVAFFERIQRTGSVYSDAVPAYLRTHPLTTERIADIQARIREERYRQHGDSLDFHLIRARVRVLQEDNPPGWRQAEQYFASQLQHPSLVQQIAAQYGLALIALREGAPGKALSLAQQAHSLRPRVQHHAGGAPLASLSIDIRLAAGEPAEAVREAEAARHRFPLARGIAWQYADALMAAARWPEAVSYLRDQLQMYREEPQLHQRLARAYAGQGRQALQHMALAEHYALTGSLPAALDQLAIARRAPDAAFHDQAVIDVREKEFRQRWLEELKESQQR